MAYAEIEYEVVDRVATITLNRPDRLNAFTFVMRDELIVQEGVTSFLEKRPAAFTMRVSTDLPAAVPEWPKPS
jgi:hypothetical protein